MTKEEAIARIREHKIIHKMHEPRAIYISETLDMAIKALKQEPCGDCISRAEAMRAITDEWVHTYGNHTLEGFTDALYNLPAVTPERAGSEGEG